MKRKKMFWRRNPCRWDECGACYRLVGQCECREIMRRKREAVVERDVRDEIRDASLISG